MQKDSVFIGHDWMDEWSQNIVKLNPNLNRFVLVSDSNVGPLFRERIETFLLPLLQNATKKYNYFEIPPGEAFKTREVKAQVEDFLLSIGAGRDTCLLACGGGVVGDLVGFVAATFMRGIPFVQIPTSLLSMVDASVGGKTAVDTDHGKNLIGAFWQPLAVYIDSSFLRTLPKRQFINGLAEIIKTAVFSDEEEFEYLENNVQQILNISEKGCCSSLDIEILQHIIFHSVETKAKIVTEDERETGLRGLLNFGHSVGHAIEANFTPHLLHGEAISIGMVKEAEISRFIGHLNQIHVSRIVGLLQSYGLPTSLNDQIVVNMSNLGRHPLNSEVLLEFMRVDKKNEGDKKKLVLLKSIGETVEPRASFVHDEIIKIILSPSVSVFRKEIINDKVKEIFVDVPGSKSISNRVLLLAALGKGVCRIRGLLYSDDTKVMLQALQRLTKRKFYFENGGETLIVEGCEGKLFGSDKPLYLGNAGTAARFLTTVSTLVSGENGVVLTGNNRMKQRPIGPLVEALRGNSCDIDYIESEGSLPLKIKSSGKLKGGSIMLSANLSSQYVSSILMAAPYAEQDVTLILGESSDAKVVSQPYIDMTISVMKDFGVSVVRDDENRNIYYIKKGIYKNPAVYEVEKDASSATYPLALAAITGCKVTIHNLGSKSLQGDARFALDVLKPMGCEVFQDENKTVVIGPVYGHLRSIPLIDMEPMTDAFLTASVLAAVATNDHDSITCITGIANQRVKECNRIAAMRTELSKFGIETSELPDGIKIKGKSLLNFEELKRPSSVHCYDDHRVAMSFSILASAVEFQEGVTIDEKYCVEKTWPSWWGTLYNNLNVPLSAADSNCGTVHNLTSKDKYSNNSIILIGLRGVGKTNLGFLGAKAMNHEFIDMDEAIAAKANVPLSKHIETVGWDQFRNDESELLYDLMNSKKKGTVISCGGGVVESEKNRNILKKMQDSFFIIWIKRDADDVIQELSRDLSRPSLKEDLRSVWERRRSFYDECSNYEFTMVREGHNYEWDKVNKSWIKYLDNILSNDLNFLSRSNTKQQIVSDYKSHLESSNFLSLTFDDVRENIELIRTCSSNVDAVELRVDLLKSQELHFVEQQVTLLNYHLDKTPIIFTVRTEGEGGKYKRERFEELKSLIKHAISWGCNFIDVELNWPESFLEEITKLKRNSKLIGSYHSLEEQSIWSNISKVMKYVQLGNMYSDIIKIVSTCILDDNFKMFIFQQSESFKSILKTPVIMINMGPSGRISRILNKFMTPITSEKFPSVSALGQMTLKEINEARCLLGLIPTKNCFLFGFPIDQSPSPFLHNRGFETIGIQSNFKYSLFEANNVSSSVLRLLESESFGGASVTIPLKESIIPHLDKLTDAAQSIKAVNTIIVTTNSEGKRILYGENTDWIGILKSIENISGASHSPRKILVIGAGGTARAAIYAAKKLTSSSFVYVFNRTIDKAKALAHEFHIELHGQQVSQYDIIISTIPGSAQEEVYATLEKYFDADHKTLVDVAYRPKETKFLLKAKEKSWKTVNGVKILVEQGFEQFKIWTGRYPPNDLKDEVLLQFQ